jgi:hypothetical protein
VTASSASKSKLFAFLSRPEIVALAVIAALIRLYWIVYIDRPPNVQLDFSCYYVWAVAMRRGLNPYQIDLTSLAQSLGIVIGPEIRATYAPTFILLFEPLTEFAPWTAYWIWSGLSVILLLLSIGLAIAPRLELFKPAALIIFAAAILYRPVQVHFEFLQVQILVLFLLIMMFRSLRADDDDAAALYLAFAGLLKGYPLFMLLYLVCMRRWRAVASTMIALAAGFVITVATIGPRALWFFSAAGSRLVPANGYLMLPKVGVAGAVLREFARFSFHRGPGIVFSEWAISGLLQLVIFAMTTYATLKSRGDDTKGEYAFGLCVAAMVLLVPNAWPHYMVLLLLPLCQLAVAQETENAPRLALWLAAIAYVLVEVGHSGAYIFQDSHVHLASWLSEGMFISTLLTYAAAYALTAMTDRETQQIA